MIKLNIIFMTDEEVMKYLIKLNESKENNFSPTVTSINQ